MQTKISLNEQNVHFIFFFCFCFYVERKTPTIQSESVLKLQQATLNRFFFLLLNKETSENINSEQKAPDFCNLFFSCLFVFFQNFGFSLAFHEIYFYCQQMFSCCCRY